MCKPYVPMNCLKAYERVLIPHLTVFPAKDSCNTCDCYDGELLCTKKNCGQVSSLNDDKKCMEGKRCLFDRECGGIKMGTCTLPQSSALPTRKIWLCLLNPDHKSCPPGLVYIAIPTAFLAMHRSN